MMMYVHKMLPNISLEGTLSDQAKKMPNRLSFLDSQTYSFTLLIIMLVGSIKILSTAADNTRNAATSAPH